MNLGAILSSALGVVKTVLPLVTDSEKIAAVITALQNVVPVVTKQVSDVAPLVRNIITALRGNPQTTAEQLEQLDALDKQFDEAFDRAAAKALAEDEAAEAMESKPANPA